MAVLDFDNDGRLDVFFANGARIPGMAKDDPRFWNRLFHNEGGSAFREVTERAGVRGEGYSMGASVADFDNDGWADLYVTGVNRNVLYHNRGDGTFADVTEQAGVRATTAGGKKLWSVGAVWLDYDNDGDLDLFVVNYLDWSPERNKVCGTEGKRLSCPPTDYQGLPNLLYRNEGAGRFSDVSGSTGIGAHVGKGMSVAVADANGDGFADVFVANDQTRHFLFRNVEGRTFVEAGVEAGVAFTEDGVPVSGMGADFRDINQDGRPDIFVTALSGYSFPLYLNTAEGFFVPSAHAAGLGFATVLMGGWGTGAYDLDNDGYKDLLSANGHVSENIDFYMHHRYRQRERRLPGWSERPLPGRDLSGGSGHAARTGPPRMRLRRPRRRRPRGRGRVGHRRAGRGPVQRHRRCRALAGPPAPGHEEQPRWPGSCRQADRGVRTRPVQPRHDRRRLRQLLRQAGLLRPGRGPDRPRDRGPLAERIPAGPDERLGRPPPGSRRTVSDAGRTFFERRAMARRRAVVASLLGVCLHGGGLAKASPVGRDPCAGTEHALRQASEALDKGQWVEAEGHLRPLEAANASCGRVALGLARLRAARGDTAEAERLFERATSLAPDALSHALFARYWLSRGQLARADHESSLALSLDRDCAEALVVGAQISSLRGRPQEAYQALEKAARLSPASAEAQYQLGVLLFRRKLHAEAIPRLEKAAALRPTDARTLDYLALGFEALGAAEQADAAYRKALRVNDEGPFFDAFLDYNYGSFLLKEGRFDESRSHLDKALVLLPGSRGVRYERGKLSLTLGQYQAAREDAEFALSLRDPGGSVLDLQVYYLLATVYARLGETDLARKYADLARTTPIPGQD